MSNIQIDRDGSSGDTAILENQYFRVGKNCVFFQIKKHVFFLYKTCFFLKILNRYLNIKLAKRSNFAFAWSYRIDIKM